MVWKSFLIIHTLPQRRRDYFAGLDHLLWELFAGGWKYFPIVFPSLTVITACTAWAIKSQKITKSSLGQEGSGPQSLLEGGTLQCFNVLSIGVIKSPLEWWWLACTAWAVKSRKITKISLGQDNNVLQFAAKRGHKKSIKIPNWTIK